MQDRKHSREPRQGHSLCHSYTGGKTESPADSMPARPCLTLSPSALKASGQREDKAGSKGTIINMGLDLAYSFVRDKKKNQAKLRNSGFPAKRAAFVCF